MIYAVRGGLSGAEILGRTRGNLALGCLFYTVFVLAAAVHAPIGGAGAASSWRCLRSACFLLLFGLRAVWAVYAPGAGAL
jgi:fumarate reductase subunit C